jgi:hypothetical protein
VRQDRGPVITEPGVYDLSLAEYLADPAPDPSLSAGVAVRLLERSPWHAYCAHPRLGAPEQRYRRDGAIGTVFHAMFLGVGADYAVVDPTDYPSKDGNIPKGWTNKAIQDARDALIEDGKTPIFLNDFETVEAMVEAASVQLDRHEIGNFTNRPGKAEQTLLWQEGSVWCRSRPDWMPADLKAEPWIVNLKTSTCAHPDVWARLVFNTGYDLSAAHYIRSVEMTLGFEVVERFVVVETEPPHALSVIELSRNAMWMAEKRRSAAVEMWRACLERDSWPGYPRRVCTIDLPPYREAQQTEREIAGRYDPAYLDVLIEASAP